MSEWSVRISIYGAGEAINNAGQLDNYIWQQINGLKNFVTNRYIAAVAQLDASSFSSFRYILDPKERYPIEKIENFNAGDPRNLVDFVAWSSTLCPAKRSIIVLSGHGAAWKDQLAQDFLDVRALHLPVATRLETGVSHIFHPRRIFGSKTSKIESMTKALLIDGGDRDYLSNLELGAALDRVKIISSKPIDVLVFDACLMSSWEVLQEISTSTSTVVASIDELSAKGIDLSNSIHEMTQRRGEMTPEELARLIAVGFSPSASFDSCIAINLASQNWMEAINHFKEFCDLFIFWIKSNVNNIALAQDALRLSTTSIVKFWNGGLSDFSKLASAITSISNLPSDCAVKIMASEESLKLCVLGKSIGDDYKDALGISIFSPNSKDSYLKNKPDYIRLGFSHLTGWSNVLELIYGD